MLSLGDSAKISDRERGFRGIGRLGGVAYCNTLVFTTKAKGESAETRVEWDCQKIQTMLNRHDSRFQHIEAKNLIALCVKVETQESSKKTDKSFFRVEMFGVKSVKGELLDGLKVRSYIENVAPLPFDTTKLHCAKKVDEWLVKEIPNYQTYQIFLNDSLLKKTYSQSLPIHGKQSADTLTDYEEIEIQDRQGKIIARGWRGIRQENIGAILSSSGFAGLRVRVGNILIGDEKLLDSCFGGNSNDRFNGYQVGEIHVTASELIPNGRRDDFQDSEIKNDFLNGVSKIAVDLVKEIRNIPEAF